MFLKSLLLNEAYFFFVVFLCLMRMMQFIREIYPVGQGGFAFEMINDYSIVYDCGSISHHDNVRKYIDRVKSFTDTVDRLYISHFDKDHVNGIRALIERVRVKKVIIPYIPREYRVAYNIVTGGAYQSMLDLFSNKSVELFDLEVKNTVSNNDIWEWIAIPMLDKTDWRRLRDCFLIEGIVIGRLLEPTYVESVKYKIRDCFKRAFRHDGGPNSKGLILLSQKVNRRRISSVLTHNRNSLPSHDETAALYLGDADVKQWDNVKIVKDILNKHLRGSLLLTQIPHHGSNGNSGPTFDQDVPSRYYYYHDCSPLRLQRNSELYATLTSGFKERLLEVGIDDANIIKHIVKFRFNFIGLFSCPS